MFKKGLEKLIVFVYLTTFLYLMNLIETPAILTEESRSEGEYRDIT
jgi:hypothetical protein